MPKVFADPVQVHPQASRLFAQSLRRVLVVWLIGLILVTLLAGLADRGLFISALTISVASGLVAIAALFPVAWFVRRALSSDSPASDESLPEANSGDLISAFTVGIALRLFGTVALFLLCRYQLGQQPEAIAVLVGVWYVLLTSVEVISIAKFNSDFHHSVGDLHAIKAADAGHPRHGGDEHHAALGHSPLTE